METIDERAIVIDCEGEKMVGILHSMEQPKSRGLLIVVGGPQYRVGSHRQFVLLARDLAGAGTPVLRFDCRGMGDSDGNFVGFEAMDNDIGSAIDAFFEVQPGLKNVVVWGLCDAASAALMYAHTDSRVSGLVLLNPWVRSDAGEAKAIVRYYYVRQITSANFWRRLLRGDVAIRKAIGDLGINMSRSIDRKSARNQLSETSEVAFIERMTTGMVNFGGRVLIILSGNDLTAAEFSNLTASSKQWRRLLRRPTCRVVELSEADHTFSTKKWRSSVELETRRWLAGF